MPSGANSILIPPLCEGLHTGKSAKSLGFRRRRIPICATDAEPTITETNHAARAKMFNGVIAEFSEWSGHRLGLLYNNAGIGIAGYFEKIPLSRSVDIINVNLIGVIHGIYAALPLLKQTPNSLCFSTSS